MNGWLLVALMSPFLVAIGWCLGCALRIVVDALRRAFTDPAR